MGGSGRGELGDLLSDGLVDQDELQGLLGQIAAGDQPLVVLLDEQRTGQADQRGDVGRSEDRECPWLTVANRWRRARNGTEMARPVRTTVARAWR